MSPLCWFQAFLPSVLILTRSGGRDKSECGWNLHIATIWNRISHGFQRSNQVISFRMPTWLSNTQSQPEWGHLHDWRWQVKEELQGKEQKWQVTLAREAALVVQAWHKAMNPYLPNRSWTQTFQSYLTCTFSDWQKLVLQTTTIMDTLSLRRNQFWGKGLGNVGSADFCWPLYPSPRPAQGLARSPWKFTEMDVAPRAKVGADTDQGQATLPLMSLDPSDDEAKPTAMWN